MDTSAELVLEAAVDLLQQFLDPDEGFVQAVCTELAVPEPEDAHSWYEILTRALRPQDSDYERVFLGDAAERARQGYKSLWESDSGLAIVPKPGQIQLRVVVVAAASLGTDPVAADAFPGGYQRIVSSLRPECYWVVWEFCEPAERYGMAYNGLVYLDGRFAWFPKPWRVLEGE